MMVREWLRENKREVIVVGIELIVSVIGILFVSE